MENYAAAYLARAIETDILHQSTPKKCTVGTVHFGGITIECILKDMIVKQHRITRWGECSKRNGKQIDNPIHDLPKAINLIEGLRVRLDANPKMVAHLDVIKKPILGYIKMRYTGKKVPEARYSEWYNSYEVFRKWLIAQQVHLPR